LSRRVRHLVEPAARLLLGVTSLACLVWLGYRTTRYLPIVGSPGLFVLFYGFNVFAAYKLWRSKVVHGAISCAILLYQVRMHMSFRIDFDSGTTDGLFGLPTAALSFTHLMFFVLEYLRGNTRQRTRMISREA
jgi:hypothetical protein